jgi:cytochrome c
LIQRKLTRPILHHKDVMRHWRWTCLLAAALGGTSVAGAGELENRGHALLTRLCARCHAVEKTGTSPHRGAPPFRAIGDRYNIGELTERMTDRLISTHPDMPDFKFSEDDAAAVRAYLYAIQQ